MGLSLKFQINKSMSFRGSAEESNRALINQAFAWRSLVSLGMTNLRNLAEKTLFLPAILIWSISIFPAYAAPVPSDENLAGKLTEDLTQYDKLSRQIKSLEKALQKLEVLSDPDRDDRYWWNPFWRASRESQLQQANKLSLQLQELDRRHRLLELDLLEPARQYARRSLENHQTLSPEQNLLWNRADAWRIPILLREPAWEILTPRTRAAQTPELLTRRLQTLRRKAEEWQVLDKYLKARLVQIDPANPEKHRQYSSWQTKLQTNIEKLQSILETLKAAQALPLF